MKKGFDYSKAKEIEVEVEGKKFTGKYTLSGGVLTVSSMYGQTATQLGGLTQESLARILLRKLVTRSK